MNWSFTNRDNYIPCNQNYHENLPGHKIECDDLHNCKSAFDYFKLYFTPEIASIIAKESNLYFSNKLKAKYGDNFKDYNFCKNSYGFIYLRHGNIEKDDIFGYIGALIFMGLHWYPQLIKYWSNDILYNNYLSTRMTKNFFKMLSCALHIPISDENNPIENQNEFESELDNEQQVNETNIVTDDKSLELDDEKLSERDPRNKINLLISKTIIQCKKYWCLGNILTIDESMVAFKGRNKMKFFMPHKPIKWGFKIHVLVDAINTYVYNFIMDPGQENKNLILNDKTFSFTENIVLSLLEGLEKSGKKVFFDSWYSSINLCGELSKREILFCSTLRANAKNIPNNVEISKSSKNYAYSNSKSGLIQLYFSEKKGKVVKFLSNFDKNVSEIRDEYNKYARGVDTLDEKIAFYEIKKKNVKWWKKIFYFIIEVCINNAMILYNNNEKDYITEIQFKEKLCKDILSQYNKLNLKDDKFLKNRINKIPKEYLDRLHHLIEVKNKNERKRCKKCYDEKKIDNKVYLICKECNLGFHLQCFLNWHKKYVYQ